VSAAERLTVRFQKLPHALDLPEPAVASGGSSGSDLRAAVAEALVLEPGGRALVPTGIRVEIPAGFEGQVRPRSGLAARYGVTVLNAPGTVDSDYRGEVAVVLVNLGAAAYTIRRGDRIAQIVIARVALPSWEEVEGLSESERGAGGFGSTGSG
jgi:dUTP pyrophosphatase